MSGSEFTAARLSERERRELDLFVEEYSVRTGTGSAYLEEAFTLALEDSMLEFETVLSRMRWLLDPTGTKTIALLASRPDLTPRELARHVVAPKEAVLEFIAANSAAAPGTIEEIYHAAMTSSRDPYGIHDLSEERILQEMKWWIVELGFPPYYFESMPPSEIAHQILVNRFYEIQGFDSESYKSLRISYRSPKGTGIHWVHRGKKHLELEYELESAWYTGKIAYDISVYSHEELYLYIVQSSPAPEAGRDFASATPGTITREIDEERFVRYREVYEAIRRSGSLRVEYSRKAESGEYRLMIGFPSRTITHFLADVSRLLDSYGIEVNRKYTVTFSGTPSIIISSFYSDRPFPEDILPRLVEIGLYPDSRLSECADNGTLTPAETGFAHALIGFVHAFITRRDPNLELLQQRFGHDAGFREAAVALRRRLSKEAYPRSKIENLFAERPEVVKKLYAVFARKFDPAAYADGETVRNAVASLAAELASQTAGQDEQEIFSAALSFITSTVRTNFYLPQKTALAFRLSPEALTSTDYPAAPFGIFYIRGRNFTAFHVRFTDIARGGIRIVRSGAPDEFRRNEDALFEECYNLAWTQNRKNKDIPEGGAKGVILPDMGMNAPGDREDAFMKYIDALLDLMLPQNSRYTFNFAEEILFLGPDEGTAELMDAACIRARERGYAYWKAFTTGKSASLGGISHIRYGMTTAGIRRYVLGILGDLNADERRVTKIQTGGPDGDLGGNEILSSRDRTIAIADGSGVLYDPEGLEREELSRLARLHLDCSKFDTAKLSQGGFLVKVTDRDILLPDGTSVASGLAFRNGFHLGPYLKADLFVPCGGRPASINGTNWQLLLDGNGKPRVRWIVEGANLFITQEARLELEKRGVVLFKDSSTNKGGVTSSSLEVLSGLGLEDSEFGKLMCAATEEEGSRFRQRYIEEIIGIIRENADAEFRVLRDTHAQTGTPISELSDALSDRIIGVTRDIAASGLFDNTVLRRNVLALHAPASLIEAVGIGTLLLRIPESYLRAIFARTVARRFVYEYGITPGYEDYRTFIERLVKS